MTRVLVADPYPEIRELLAHVVSGVGYEPVAYRGEEAETLDDVDILLLEPALPGGLELARSLRARDPGLPIVCLSIYPPTPETSALSPLAYLLKPFALAELQRTLRDAGARAQVPA